MTYGHYTTATSLIGILKNEVLWATNIKFLNDEHEFQHALDLARKVIIRSKEKFDRTSKFANVYDLYITEIEKTFTNLELYSSESIFTCSFSEQTDLLSQWRGYCPGNQGYCLHFNIEKILEFALIKYPTCKIFKCVYDKSEKETKIAKVLNEHWHRYYATNEVKIRETVIDDLAEKMIILASHFKHPSFAEEKEHRLVIQLNFDASEHTKFRAGPLSIIPYIEIPAPRNFIEEICVGPTRVQQLAQRGLFALIEAKYEIPIVLTSVTVSESSIPYRA